VYVKYLPQVEDTMTTGRLKSVKCPKCGSSDIVSDLDVGERICTHCGLVLDEDVLEVSRDGLRRPPLCIRRRLCDKLRQ
jgi:ribosomal protein S27E